MYCDTWTPERLERVFSPGRRLDLLVAGRERALRQGLRQTQILGRSQDDLALDQPQPSQPQLVLGQSLEVTVLVDDQGAPQRYAYRTNVLDLLDAFSAPAGPCPAMVVTFPRCEDLYATNLRRARRYRVGPQTPVSLVWDQAQAQLIDLSIKGLRYAWSPGGTALTPGEALDLVLVIHDERFAVKGRVAGLHQDGERTEVAVELGILPLDAWASLQELIQTLEPQGEE